MHLVVPQHNLINPILQKIFYLGLVDVSAGK